MDAGLLFYQAHRTAACQLILSRASEEFGIPLHEVRVCIQADYLNPSIAGILKARNAVFLVASAPEKRPTCSEAIFYTLHVPLRPDGEPEGILRLTGCQKTGYLIESIDQAIVLLPDEPSSILKMAPAVFGRLKSKFDLPGEFPKKCHPDYEKLVETCMGIPPD